jgi:hypothetical protein
VESNSNQYSEEIGTHENKRKKHRNELQNTTESCRFLCDDDSIKLLSNRTSAKKQNFFQQHMHSE